MLKLKSTVGLSSVGLILVFLFSFVIVAEAQEYNQAPMLNELVEAGELPPLGQRLPKSPLVQEPVEAIGEYGGELRSVFAGPTQLGPITQNGCVQQALPVWISPQLEVSPALLSSWEWISDNQFRIHLREGVKWSDGEPFTAEDVIYAVNAFYDVPFYSGGGMLLGKLDKVERHSEFAVDLYPKKGRSPLMKFWIRGLPIEPKHYLEEYDPRFNDEMEMQDLESAWAPGRLSEAWIERPTLGAYRAVRVLLGERVVFERNPYYWMVDSEGNQLPYIDRWIFNQVENPNNTAPALVKAGELDFQNRHILIGDYQFYKQNENRGNFNTISLQMGSAGPAFHPNFSNQDQKLAKLFEKKKFLMALSIGLNREFISKSAYFGLTEPWAYTALRNSPVFPGEKYGKMYTEYNPQRAKELLDELGLKDTNGDGWREYPDGDKLSIILDIEINEVGGPPAVGEIAARQWRQLGLKVTPNPIKLSLMQARWANDNWDLCMWRLDVAIYPPARVTHWSYRLTPKSPYAGHTFGGIGLNKWHHSGGTEGVKPPEFLRRINELHVKATEASTEEELLKFGKEHARRCAEDIAGISTTTNAAIAIANKDLVNVPDTWLFSYLAGGLNQSARPWQFAWSEQK